MNGFLKLISPFIDPLTKEKLKFNEDLRKHAPPEQLWNEYNGDLEFDYDHSIYWPALLQLCEERRREQKERWEKAGKHYGESEYYLKGGSLQSIGKETSEPDAAKPGGSEQEVKRDNSIKPIQENATADVPVQPNGTSVNGNMDSLAQQPNTNIESEAHSA